MRNAEKLNAVDAAPNRGPGRPRGARNKISKAQIAAALASGEQMPLDYMLCIMRNEKLPMPIRFEAAKAAAPFCHSKLAAIQHEGTASPHEDFVKALS
jgi:hypothetical protein